MVNFYQNFRYCEDDTIVDLGIIQFFCQVKNLTTNTSFEVSLIAYPVDLVHRVDHRWRSKFA